MPQGVCLTEWLCLIQWMLVLTMCLVFDYVTGFFLQCECFLPVRVTHSTHFSPFIITVVWTDYTIESMYMKWLVI